MVKSTHVDDCFGCIASQEMTDMSSQQCQHTHVGAGSIGSSRQHIPLALLLITSVADVHVATTATSTSRANKSDPIVLQPTAPKIERIAQNKCAQ